MMALKIILALTIPLLLLAVTIAWVDFTANATRILQGDLPGNQRWGEAE